MDGDWLIMPGMQDIQAALSDVRDFSTFAKRLLRDTLGWPLPEDAESVEEIGYAWSAEDLRAEGLEGHLLDCTIHQIPPLAGRDQPWGVFIVHFEKEEVFTGRRGMAGPLRRVLRGLVNNRRNPSHLPAWDRDDLLFICTYRWTHYAIVHFEQPQGHGRAARLATFGWNPDSPNRTLIEHNLPHLTWPGDPPDAEAWRRQWLRAFDKEKLTDEYFRKLVSIFDEALVSEIQKSPGMKDAETARAAALILMNRLLFLSFIQRKGWLDGKTDYLIRAFEAHRAKPKSRSFYADVLHPLFLALSLPRRDRESALGSIEASRLRGIPFLNGGLFEPQASFTSGDLHVTNATFARLFDELLERYNFTVTEDTDLDIEVAVDPEMLGKIFEELVTGRHETGAYYTPKPIVAFMCREALKGYLGGGASIERFVDEREPEGLIDPEAVLEKLKAIRVCDPACGSGAYLVGMLHELLDLRRCLFTAHRIDPVTDYQRKLKTIQDCLYGVDIDPTAVNLARLRLWLTLAVDFEGEEPQPLPNLDFKIEANDSLAGPDPSDSLTMDLHRNRLLEYYRLKAAYAETNLYGDKQELKAKIEAIREELSDWAHAGQGVKGLDWRIEFGEIFDKRDSAGFDVVLANPPYVRQEIVRQQHGEEYKHVILRRNFPDVWSGTADLYCFFYARALQLLRPEGMLVFISSNKWLRTKYGSKLRRHLTTTCTISTIIDFGDLPVFQDVIAYPLIIVAQKGENDDGAIYSAPESLDPPYPNLRLLLQTHGHLLAPEAISGSDWTFRSSEESSFMDLIAASGVSLRDYLGERIYRGITTGLNEVFIIDEETKNALLREDSRSQELLKPYASNRHVQRWRLDDSREWIIFTRRGVNIDKYPAILRYLAQWREKLEPRPQGWGDSDGEWQGRKAGRYAWYEIQDDIAYYRYFSELKIISTKMSIRPTFALDASGRYPGNTTYCLSANKDPLFVLACLNSSIFERYARLTFVEKQSGWYEVQPNGLERFPVPSASVDERRRIGKLAKRCIEARGIDCGAWEREIDERVAALYGV